MGLYKNIIQFDWNLTAGEYVAFIRYPFQELTLDPVFKVTALDLNNYTADLTVVESSFLAPGTIYLQQPLQGLRRVKLMTIDPESLGYGESTIPPPEEMILMEDGSILTTEDGNYLIT